MTATAVSPYIIRVDDIAPGEKPSGVRTVLPMTGADDFGFITDNGTTLTTTADIYAIAKDGILTITGPDRGTTVIDHGAILLPDGRQEIALSTDATGSVYGTGERAHKYNLSGDTLHMYNRANYGYRSGDRRNSQMNINMPLYLASEGYAIVFDDYAASTLILNNPVKYITEATHPVSYYYVGAAENLSELTEELTELTGRQPLAPFWSLGYITSKYGYRTQDETLGVIDTLKTQGYPVDGLVLDLYWYGKEQDMGRLDWESEQWPDPTGMLRTLHERGVNTLAITQPFVLRNGKGVDNYEALAAEGLFVADSLGHPHNVEIWVGEGGMFDVANPATQQWLRNRYRDLTLQGMGGWWGDLGEPERHPETGIHANGLPARQYHNNYGNDWAKIISDLYADEFADRRLMILMRAGTTGLQRYSVFPWSSDVSRSWGGLEPQIRLMLNSGLSGLAYMSSDLGGFAPEHRNPINPELYVRWLQAGLFTPIFRTHSSVGAEPYNYPQYADIILPLVRERYRWLPYNYTLAYENAAYGRPLLRPLDFGIKARGLYDDVNDEYLWGSELLVAPVITEGAVERAVVFPEGSDWYDYSDPRKVYAGGTTVEAYPAPLAKLPLFVRAGAFLPTADYPMENTGDYRADEYTVNYYPGAESFYSLFDDNRMSPSTLADGQYRLINFSGKTDDKNINIQISSEGTYAGAPATVTLHMVVNGLTRKPKVRGAEGAEFDSATGECRFTLRYVPGTKVEINLKK
ncbi:MAG: DUF5110 domain-containing protein [Muribaculaceae bacterium]|nr:DUF5110 domain-containing protein [Muribaculaceae bacterium]